MTSRIWLVQKDDGVWLELDAPSGKKASINLSGLVKGPIVNEVLRELGTPVNAVDALAAIAAELDGQVWSPETLDRIADHVRRAGLEVREP